MAIQVAPLVRKQSAMAGIHPEITRYAAEHPLAPTFRASCDAQTKTWGIKVSNLEIRTVELTENMVRAIAKQAEAKRDRRAKIMHQPHFIDQPA